MRGVACVRTGRGDLARDPDALGLAVLRCRAPADAALHAARRRRLRRRPPERRGGFGFADDVVLLATHGATHIDASATSSATARCTTASASEVGSGARAAAGSRRRPDRDARGVRRLRARWVPAIPPGCRRPRAAAGADRHGASSPAGDALLVRTGWTEAWQRGAAVSDTWPGLDSDCADWIAEREVALVGADNLAVDGYPSSVPGCDAPLHLSLLRDRGVYLCELLDLSGLAAAGRSTCMLVVAPLPLHGAVASPVNPVAIL